MANFVKVAVFLLGLVAVASALRKGVLPLDCA